MRCQLTFTGASRRRLDDVAEGLRRRDPPESAGSPAPKIVLDPTDQWLAKDQPRFPHRTRHHAHVCEFDVSGFGPIPAPHGHDKTSDFATSLQSCTRQRTRDEKGEQRVARNDDVRTRNKDALKSSRPSQKELFQDDVIARRKNCETGQRGSLNAIEAGRDAPDATLARAKFVLLGLRVFEQAVGWISDHRMNRVAFTAVDPRVAFIQKQRSPTVDK